MTDFRPIWTPDDYRNTVADARREQWWLAQSRHRRAALMDGLAVALLLLTCAGLGVIVWVLS